MGGANVPINMPGSGGRVDATRHLTNDQKP